MPVPAYTHTVHTRKLALHICMYACMCVCIYIYIYIYIYISCKLTCVYICIVVVCIKVFYFKFSKSESWIHCRGEMHHESLGVQTFDDAKNGIRCRIA